MKQLPEVKNYKVYSDLILKKIDDFWNEIFFDYLESVNNESLENSTNTLSWALRHGKVWYEDGLIKSKGKFSSTLSKEIEEAGGKYNKSKKAFKISYTHLPIDIKQSIALVNANNQKKLRDMDFYLSDVADKMEFIKSKLSFESEVTKISESLDKQFARSVKTVNIIPYDLTPYQINEIAKNYTYNLDKYIKKWTDEEVIKLRQEVQQFIMKGYRAEQVAEYIQKEKGIACRKARFLAAQETRLFVAEYKKNRYKEQGINQYIWKVAVQYEASKNNPHGVRPDHWELKNRVFSWDNPPVIDAATGQRGNPSEAYNCRCQAIAVVSDEWWNSAKVA